MHKIKTSYYYLERGFPENLKPAFTNKSTKRKRFLVERKKKILKRAIRKSLQTLVKPFFSAPTKKGFLLEKPETRFQNGFSEEKVRNVQKKPVCSAPTTKTSLSSQSKFLTHANLFANQRFVGATRASPINGLGELPCKNLFLDQANGMDPTASANQKFALRLNQVKENGLLESPLYKRKDWKQDRQWGKCKRYKFIFPLHKLKGELSKRESQYGKIELYKKQIQEKKKLAFLYGRMSKNSIKKLVEQARNLSSTENPPIKGLVTLLESRLDVVLFRASFFSSISMARQWINHNKVHVNKKKVRAPSYQLKGGDCVEILSACALPLKEKIRRRVAQILPFRRSRKKLVTSSLMANWCSFERLFPKEKGAFSSASPREGYKENFASSAVTQNFSLIKDHLQSMWEKSVQLQQSKRSWQVGDGNPRQRRQLPLNVYLKDKCRGKESSILQSKMKGSLFSSTPNKFSQSGSFPGKKREKAGGFALQMQKGRDFDRKSSKGAISSTKIDSALQKGVALFGRLSLFFTKKDQKQMESGLATVHFLKGKQALVQPRNRMQKLAGLQVSAIKPLHLEVSYRLLTAIFLYSPQKVAYPCNLDLPLIMRSFK